MVKGRIGLNHKVGGKFPGKAWPFFDRFFSENPQYSWQEGDNLQDYVNWINSCEVLVTNDSLGLHLAIALGRKFVALFGPTLEHEVYSYGLGSKIIAEKGDMTSIDVETVRKEVLKLLAS
jgi:heptosyltransferase-2